MDKERQIHEAMMVTAAQAITPPVAMAAEQAGCPSPVPDMPSAGQDDSQPKPVPDREGDNLGDNVELF